MTDRLNPGTPGDVLELFMREQDRDIRDRFPGAFGPPEEAEELGIGPAYPPHIAKLMMAYGRCALCSAMEHEDRARMLDMLVEAAMDAAHAEWKLAAGPLRE